MREAYDSMRAKAIEATALIEALLDFGEDEGISEGVYEQGARLYLFPHHPAGSSLRNHRFPAKDKVVWLRDRITNYLDDGRRGEILRSGIHLAIVGPPNAGKSSLLNWLGALSPFHHR